MLLDPAALGPGPDVTCARHDVPWRARWGSCGPPSGGAVCRDPGWVIDIATTRSHLANTPVRGRFDKGWPTHYPSLLGPRAGLRDLASRMARWRVGLRWWLVALSPAGFLLLALAGPPLPWTRGPSDRGQRIDHAAPFDPRPIGGLLATCHLALASGEASSWLSYSNANRRHP